MPTPTPNSAFGAPLLGALMRMPVDAIRERMLAALHDQGFDDLIPAHLIVLRWPGFISRDISVTRRGRNCLT